MQFYLFIITYFFALLFNSKYLFIVHSKLFIVVYWPNNLIIEAFFEAIQN